ncbi:MAG TPA: NAD-dependent dehydratase [Candidatus Limnocylindria bacterium]|nr:NAD-dependent dehydratase [Candidatus Limnocylindria bacterium]
MRICVVGGVNFMGPDVVRMLADAGHEVLSYHSAAHELALPEAVRHLHGQRDELEQVRDAVREWQPTVALHMAAQTERQARSFVHAFDGIAERTVAISSSDVYRAYGRINLTEPGPPDPLPLTEDAPLREKLYPSRSEPLRLAGDPDAWMDEYDKIVVERVIRSATMPSTILRLGGVHGPRTYRHYAYLRRMLEGRPAIVLDAAWARWRGTHAYSENVADAIVLATTDERAAGGVYNVGIEEALSVREVLERIARVAGWSGRILALPADELPEVLREGGGLDQDFVLDTTRIRTELGYRERVDLMDGLRRMVEWMRLHPPAQDDRHPLLQRPTDCTAEDAVIARVGAV